MEEVAPKMAHRRGSVSDIDIKGALNPNFLNLTINKNLALKTFWSHFLICFY